MDIVIHQDIREYVIYRGHKYWRYPDHRRDNLRNYFHCGTKGNKGSLHRHMWEDAFGPIPEGHHIHHIKGFDNRLDNFECIHGNDHSKLHGWPDGARAKGRKARWSDPGAKDHMSQKRKDWYAGGPSQSKTCERCQQPFKAYFKTARFCGKPCQLKAYRERHRPDPR